ncbi:AbgT family transporter [uncultured Tessaracoccus sp.]|uniref:AbgT family transporter n=1 Tax=uncultured Tessaracoccus sp. TaxID=905023 RepID=UPI0025EA08BB|nr:AbgT family transporter [uncultured Tessaracoccus sp.]
MSDTRSTTTDRKPARGPIDRFLNFIEWTGNKLPDPIIIFFLLCVGTLVLSAIAGGLGWSAQHPATKETVTAVNLLTADGMRMVLGDAITTFGSFAPLGQVLIIMLGIGVAERSGWFEALLSNAMRGAPKILVIPTIALIGLLGNIAGDAAPIVLPPLAALVFLQLGWHPIAGIALAYAAAEGGFAANLMIGMSDALVWGFTDEAAKMIDPEMQTSVPMNWWFIAASVAVLLPIIWVVTAKVVIPRMGSYEGQDHEHDDTPLTPQERKANRWAIVSVIVAALVIVAACIPKGSFMRNAETGSLTTDAPLMNGIGLVLTILFFVPGLVYGLLAGSIKRPSDVTGMMVESMSSMANFIVIVFFASQMLSYITASNMGAILAIKGAGLLEGQSGAVLIVGVVVLSAFVNLFIGSASAKWAILAPIFVPMMMLLDYHPAATQMIYRVGDAITNPITPMFPYFALVLSYAQKYDKKLGIGTFISTLVPYSIAMGIGWLIMLLIWFGLGIPVGPDGPVHLN